MKNKLAVYILATIIILIFSSICLAAVPVKVAVGKGTIITLKEPSKRVSIANSDIADLNLISPSEMLINGKKPGSTNIIVWDAKGKATFFDVIVSPEAPEVPQVMLEVKVASINKSKLRDLGLSFIAKGNSAEVTSPGLTSSSGPIANPSGSINGNSPGIGGFGLGTFVPQIGVSYFKSGVGLFLKALDTKSLAKILAEPNLIVRSGEKGSFLVGSRFPVQTVTGTGASATASITFEQIGIRLDFAPEVLDSGVIRLKIDPAEVSNIANVLTLGNLVAPVIDTKTVRTSVDLREGESLILAGLLSEDTKKNIQKIPILGDIPILGLFFRATHDEITQNELAFFITPTIVKPIAPGVKTELPAEKPIPPEEEREYNWIPLPAGSGGQK